MLTAARDPAPEAMQKAIEIILDRAWDAPDQRVLLDEESVNMISILLVKSDGTLCDPEALWRERQADSEGAEAPVAAERRWPGK